ncbi:hypothetical protein [Serratia quinivorans]|uniref:hypothetical protein n=1 Tax=Serratia quinivorans TaxID=137545 RepID=UPI0021779CD3|nr:hypothetical protein [Serratia quinivorans]CAI1179542.1 Uncharacterised protein [Serratia quinivorans]CAI1979809.1 Uncharacterised protein [Serratia quinivorans]
MTTAFSSPFGSPEDQLTSAEFARMLGNGNVQAMYRDIDLLALQDSLDCSIAFHGVGIIFSDGQNSYLVRPTKHTGYSTSSQVTHVVITKTVAHTSRTAATNTLSEALTKPNVGKELASAALSCGTLLVSVFLLASGSVAVPFTGGTSSAIAYLGYAGMAASALQCGNGLYRVNKLYDGKGDELAQLDSEQWYVATSTILDVISLASAGAALKEAAMTYRAMRRVSSRKATEWLKSMPRSERKRLTESIIRAENPGISNQVLKQMVNAGLYPKRYPTQALQNGLRQQLRSALNNSMAFVGSGISGTLSSPANVKETGQYFVGIMQKLPQMVR